MAWRSIAISASALYTQQQGLPDNSIGALYIDHAGVLWIVAGVDLSRFANGKFTNFAPGTNFPLTSFRAVTEDRNGALWVAGINTVGKLIDGKLQQALSAADLDNDLVTGLAVDASDNLWIGGSKGVLERTPAGEIHRFTGRDGLPDTFLRAMLIDNDGAVWAGTNGGLARLEGERFVTPPARSRAGALPLRRSRRRSVDGLE